MITYDARGLVEPDDTVPHVSELEGERGVFDAKSLTTRQINLELRWLLYEEGVKDVTVLNPGAKHSLGVGILTRGTIIVLGRAGSMTGFMMQRGRQIFCDDVGPGLGDSMYDGTIYVAGKVKSLGIDCVPGEWNDADTELIERKFRIHGLGSPPEFQKFVCGKKLYNYDNLEPSERKLVL